MLSWKRKRRLSKRRKQLSWKRKETQPENESWLRRKRRKREIRKGRQPTARFLTLKLVIKILAHLVARMIRFSTTLYAEESRKLPETQPERYVILDTAIKNRMELEFERILRCSKCGKWFINVITTRIDEAAKLVLTGFVVIVYPTISSARLSALEKQYRVRI